MSIIAIIKNKQLILKNKIHRKNKYYKKEINIIYI